MCALSFTFADWNFDTSNQPQRVKVKRTRESVGFTVYSAATVVEDLNQRINGSAHVSFCKNNFTSVSLYETFNAEI